MFATNEMSPEAYFDVHSGSRNKCTHVHVCNVKARFLTFTRHNYYSYERNEVSNSYVSFNTYLPSSIAYYSSFKGAAILFIWFLLGYVYDIVQCVFV